MDSSRTVRTSSIGRIRDTLTKRFQRLVHARAKATGMCLREFREWVEELVGEGIAVALSEIDQWDETKEDFFYWAFLKTRTLIHRDLEKRNNQLETVLLTETTTKDARRRHDPEKEYLVKEQLQEIFRLLTREQGEALILRFLIGMKPKEMEALTGRSVTSIYSLLQRGKKKVETDCSTARRGLQSDWRDLPRPRTLPVSEGSRRRRDQEVS